VPPSEIIKNEFGDKEAKSMDNSVEIVPDEQPGELCESDSSDYGIGDVLADKSSPAHEPLVRLIRESIRSELKKNAGQLFHTAMLEAVTKVHGEQATSE
jgi:hypothetical protein